MTQGRNPDPVNDKRLTINEVEKTEGGSNNRKERKTIGREKSGGGPGIRTPGGRKSSAVFKTAAFNHSASPPNCSPNGHAVGNSRQYYSKIEACQRDFINIRLNLLRPVLLCKQHNFLERAVTTAFGGIDGR